jgi:para-nitrobenzyl esterase
MGRTDPGEIRMSRMIGRYWVNFAATGNPNGKDLPAWPAYVLDGEEMVDFAEDVTILKGYRNAQLDVVEEVLGSMTRHR